MNLSLPVRTRIRPWGIVFALCLAQLTFAAEIARKQFDLPADITARSIKAFARQAGVEVLIRAELGRESRTQAVKGEFTPREALDRMLVHTGLTVKEDELTGAMAILGAAAHRGNDRGAAARGDSDSTKKKRAKP